MSCSYDDTIIFHLLTEISCAEAVDAKVIFVAMNPQMAPHKVRCGHLSTSWKTFYGSVFVPFKATFPYYWHIPDSYEYQSYLYR
jgi:hypothetical protein